MAEPIPKRPDGIPERILRSAAEPSRSAPATAKRALSLAISPAASALAGARDRVRAFLRGFDVPEQIVFDVVLSFDEACKNAIRFGGNDREIDVTITVASPGDEISLVVRDHGVGFEPRQIDVSRTPDVLDPQGRGLFLMTCLMDDVRVVCDEGAIVTARKTVAR